MIHRRSFLLGAGATIAETALAQSNEVDTALVMLMDVSGSVNQQRFEIQREGIATAFEWPEFHQALNQTMTGRIAVAYVQWADGAHVVLPWTLIDSKAAAIDFGEKVRGSTRHDKGDTRVRNALIHGVQLLQKCPFEPLRRVIDISSDGKELGDAVESLTGAPNDEGRIARDIALIRDDFLETPGAINQINAITMLFDQPDVTEWYEKNVIGGPGSFILESKTPADFPALFRRKILTEAV